MKERHLYGLSASFRSPSPSLQGGSGVGSERQVVDDLGPDEPGIRQEEEDCWVI
jgi:hypothetical protein